MSMFEELEPTNIGKMVTVGGIVTKYTTEVVKEIKQVCPECRGNMKPVINGYICKEGHKTGIPDEINKSYEMNHIQLRAPGDNRTVLVHLKTNKHVQLDDKTSVTVRGKLTVDRCNYGIIADRLTINGTNINYGRD